MLGFFAWFVWFCVYLHSGSLLTLLGNLLGAGIKPGPLSCKVNALPAVLSLWPEQTLCSLGSLHSLSDQHCTPKSVTLLSLPAPSRNPHRPYGKDVPRLDYWLTYETIMKKAGGRPHWAKVGRTRWQCALAKGPLPCAAAARRGRPCPRLPSSLARSTLGCAT